MQEGSKVLRKTMGERVSKAWSGCLHEDNFSGILLDLSLFPAYVWIGESFIKL